MREHSTVGQRKTLREKHPDLYSLMCFQQNKTDLDPVLLDLVRAAGPNGRIAGIKAVREESGWGLKEAKEFSDKALAYLTDTDTL